MILTVTVDSVLDVNGNWTGGTTTTIEKQCRAEPSGGNGYVKGPGGDKINYSWKVYIPLPVETIQVGTQIEIQDTVNNNETILKDKVLQFSRGQQNARAWL